MQVNNNLTLANYTFDSCKTARNFKIDFLILM